MKSLFSLLGGLMPPQLQLALRFAPLFAILLLIGAVLWQRGDLRRAEAEAEIAQHSAADAEAANAELQQRAAASAAAERTHAAQLNALRGKYDAQRQILDSIGHDACFDAGLPAAVVGLLQYRAGNHARDPAADARKPH